VPNAPTPTPRPPGTLAVSVQGITAVLGGAPIVLAGAAFAAAGVGAFVALLANFVVAAAGAFALATLAARFRRGGGVFMFAQRVLGPESGFAVGWTMLLGSLAAAVLFALGVATFATSFAATLLASWGIDLPAGATSEPLRIAVALAVIAAVGVRIARRLRSPPTAVAIAKVIGIAGIGAFGIAASGGAVAIADLLTEPPFPGGTLGVLQAMGIMFIAYQGVTVPFGAASDVRDPMRTLTRASLLTLAVATVLYAALFLAATTAPRPAGMDLAAFGRWAGGDMIARGAQAAWGGWGIAWVAITAMLAMVTALEAQLQGAARLVRSMAQGGTLPRVLARGSRWDAPRWAALAAAGLAGIATPALPDVASAGVAAGIVFLAVMAFGHTLAALVRWRETASRRRRLLRVAPWVLAGGVTAAVAVVNVVIVPAAGLGVLTWLLIGALLYIAALRKGALAFDAALQAAEPDVVALRGRRPLVLTPIANPSSASGLLSVAHALAPPQIGRVTLLHVIARDELTRGLENAHAVLAGSFTAALGIGLAPQALSTVADDPWREIEGVARNLDPETILLGTSNLGDEATLARLDGLLGRVRSDVVVLRASATWRLEGCRRVIVPLAGRSDQERLRSRLLGGLARLARPSVEVLRLLPADVEAAGCARVERALARQVEGRGFGATTCVAIPTADPVATLAARAASADLLIVGLPRRASDERAFGAFVTAVLAATPERCAVMAIHTRA
jgi:basic amino acid/polyamine antiporter, APA family